MPLDPELEAILDAEAVSGLPPRSERSVTLTRELFRRSSLASTKLALTRVQDLSANGIPLRLYAAHVTPAMPVLVYFHGGRFFSGDLDTHDALCREIAHEAQCVVVGVNYRLAPEHPCPAAVEDCVTATDWVIREAAGLGLDSNRVAVGGDSAGGCLAAVVARRFPRIAAQWLIYPMLDPGCGLPSHEEFATGFGPGSADMLRGWMEYLPVEISAHDDQITPLFIDPGSVPPAYILTAEFDCLRDEGELYAKRLGEAGNRVVHHRVPGAIHGFFQFTGRSELARSALSSACAELRALLSKGNASETHPPPRAPTRKVAFAGVKCTFHTAKPSRPCVMLQIGIESCGEPCLNRSRLRAPANLTLRLEISDSFDSRKGVIHGYLTSKVGPAACGRPGTVRRVQAPGCSIQSSCVGLGRQRARGHR